MREIRLESYCEELFKGFSAAMDEIRDLEEGRNAEFRMAMALLALQVGQIIEIDDPYVKDLRLGELKALLESRASEEQL